MRWVLRLVEAKGEGQSQSTDVMETVRPDDLGNIADLGLTLAEAKVLQAARSAGSRRRSSQRPCRATAELSVCARSRHSLANRRTTDFDPTSSFQDQLPILRSSRSRSWGADRRASNPASREKRTIVPS